MLDLKEVLYGIARAIVDSPDEVTVVVAEDDDTVTLTLSVAPDDMGLVIGRHGRIAKAIRTVMKAAAGTVSKKVNVEIR
ncbi:MAG: KH domain-containing protein [Clostridia bacterium]|nr:KH domain-containing protein [Clostridia bacterium]